MTFLGIKSPRLLRLALGITVLLAVVSIGNIVYKAYRDNAFHGHRWGHDFVQWWDGGKLLIQGENPYSIQVPSAAPVVLVMAPLSLFDWVSATLIWAVANVILAILCVWLMTKLSSIHFLSIQGQLIFFLLLSLIATRQVIELGQISLLIAASTLGALWLLNKKPLFAGVLLGFALSKYTMSFPLLLYCLWTKRYKVLLSSLILQAGSLLLIAFMSTTNPLQIIQDYLRYSGMILVQTQTYSIHLLSLNWGILGQIALCIFSLGIAIGLIVWYRQTKDDRHLLTNELTGITLVGILTIWSMYSLYHGRQDMVLVFIFITTALNTPQSAIPTLPSVYAITFTESRLLNGFLWIVLVFWIAPLYLVIGLPVYRSAYALINVAISFVWLWLLFRIKPAPTMLDSTLTTELSADQVRDSSFLT